MQRGESCIAGHTVFAYLNGGILYVLSSMFDGMYEGKKYISVHVQFDKAEYCISVHALICSLHQLGMKAAHALLNEAPVDLFIY